MKGREAMRYVSPILFAALNLTYSLMPWNPLGWMNALVFFGCMGMIGSMAGYDLAALAFRRAK
jgi:hypothetical protein